MIDTFGSIREVVLDSNDPEGFHAFDLDSGTAVVSPGELRNFQYSDSRRLEFEQWTRQRGGDAYYYQWDATEFESRASAEAQVVRKTRGFFDGAFFAPQRHPFRSWIFGSRGPVGPWQALHWSRLTALPISEQAFERMTASELYRLLEGRELINHEKSVRSDLPGTYAFRTADGATGILQMQGQEDKGRKLRIRYKLVKDWSVGE